MRDGTNRHPLNTIPGYYAAQPGIQIGTQLPADASAEQMQFARQLGIEWVMTAIDPQEEPSLVDYVAIRERFEAHGLQIYRLGNSRCHNMEEVTLNLPGRDAKIDEYLRYIRNLGRAGIRYATYAHMGNGIWSSGREAIRGGATGRALHLDDHPTGHWGSKTWQEPLSHGRTYSEEELWENYAYFMERVTPIAEEADVYIGIHPDDPPVYPMGGVPRCIFGTYEGYERALTIADSSHIGVCLCVGCWLEGGKAMGADVLEAIHHFGSQDKLFKVHLRNVTAPLPEGFVETYLDDGYMQMRKVISALQKTGFDGAVISDHLPQMVGGRHAAEAYAVGYMRALIESAKAEG